MEKLSGQPPLGLGTDRSLRGLGAFIGSPCCLITRGVVYRSRCWPPSVLACANWATRGLISAPRPNGNEPFNYICGLDLCPGSKTNLKENSGARSLVRNKHLQTRKNLLMPPWTLYPHLFL